MDQLMGLNSIGTASLNQSLEVEASVLGSVLLDPSVMDEIHSLLEPRDFAIESHSLIWQAIKHKYSQDEPIDLITITDTLGRYKRLEDVGGMDYLKQLLASVPTALAAPEHARIVQREAYRRRGIQAAHDIIEITQTDEHEDNEEYFQAIENSVTSIRPKASGTMRSISDTRDEFFQHLDKKDDFIKTGFRQFDDAAGGIDRGALYILAGRPSVGKTAKALQMSVNIAKQNKGDVLIWSQEMGRNQILTRMLSASTGVNFNRIRRKTLDDDERQTLRRGYDQLAELPLHIEDASNATIEGIRATARQFKRQSGQIGAIIVDYLQIMQIPQLNGESRAQAVGRVSHAAKAIARDLDCAFILLSQLNREGAGEPFMHHLRDSGNIEQDADFIELLWHDENETSSRGKVIQSKIDKARDATTGVHKYLFRGWIQHYEDYEG